jgi:hypothetical protein
MLNDTKPGAGFTVKALLRVTPVGPVASSVTVKLYTPGSVADVEVKPAVRVLADSDEPEKTTPGALVVTDELPPSSAKFEVAVIVNTPEAPEPKYALEVCVPLSPLGLVVLKAMVAPTRLVAPATEATASGNAAAINTAPAARAFTP